MFNYHNVLSQIWIVFFLICGNNIYNYDIINLSLTCICLVRVESTIAVSMQQNFRFPFLYDYIEGDFNEDSVQFSQSVMSDSLWPHGLQHARLPCPSTAPGAYSHSCPWVSDAIQTFHPLSSPSPAFNLSQHQGLFQWVSSSHQVAKVLEFQLQHQSFQWTFRTPLGWTG